MTKQTIRVGVLTAVLVCGVASVHAQFVVYDPTNYAEAVLRYEQLVRQYAFLLKQATRLPVDIASRYHAHSIDWTTHDLTAHLVYARRLLQALNEGDPSGAAYQGLVAPLEAPDDVVSRMPAAMQQRLAAAYATLEVADSTNRLAIDQAGSGRVDGPFTLQAVKNVEHDAANGDDAFQSQTALLEKIGSALAIELRLSAQTNQFQLSALEQAILDNTRKRDTEAAVMNATLRQWRYGQAYGEDLFSRTAENIDGWRPY
jgi:hypothetical protein